MSPIRPLKFVCVAGTFLAIGLPAIANGNVAVGDLATALGRCAAMTDKDARLSCYDTLAGLTPGQTAQKTPATAPLTALPRPSATALAPTGPALPAMQTTAAQFGSERLAATAPQKDEALNAIESEVATVSYNALGRFTVHLVNGQIWQQIAGDSDQARFPRTGKVVVKIERGMIGSYNLSIVGSAASFKVHRVQ